MIQWYWLAAWIVTLFIQECVHAYWERRSHVDWDRQRQALLDRIQAPSLAVYKALERVPVTVKEPKPEMERVDQI